MWSWISRPMIRSSRNIAWWRWISLRIRWILHCTSWSKLCWLVLLRRWWWIRTHWWMNSCRILNSMALYWENEDEGQIVKERIQCALIALFKLNFSTIDYRMSSHHSSSKSKEFTISSEIRKEKPQMISLFAFSSLVFSISFEITMCTWLLKFTNTSIMRS